MTRKIEKGQKNELPQEPNEEGGSDQLHQMMELFPPKFPPFICLERLILFHF